MQCLVELVVEDGIADVGEVVVGLDILLERLAAVEERQCKQALPVSVVLRDLPMR